MVRSASVAAPVVAPAAVPDHRGLGRGHGVDPCRRALGDAGLLEHELHDRRKAVRPAESVRDDSARLVIQMIRTQRPARELHVRGWDARADGSGGASG